MIEELGFEDFKEPFSWSEILRRADFKFVEEFIDGNFFYRWSLLTFLLWFFGLLLWRMNRIRDVVFIRVPDPAEEVIEGTDTWRITNRKAGKDGVQAVLLKLMLYLGLRNETISHELGVGSRLGIKVENFLSCNETFIE